jgi:lipopolysaccharide/colanic/teichoic acid biosynthesis glycosyltransferase
MRRLVDVLVVTLAILLLAPAMAIIAVSVKLTTAGTILRRTPRFGRNGRVFLHYRFRTMSDDRELTRFGRFISTLSLDELPSLWNVLRGDLTLVGPRPARLDEVRLDDSGWQKVLSVTPGLVSPSGLTHLDRFNSLDVRERIEPDIAYVEQRSWTTDLGLLTKAVCLSLVRGNLKRRR